MQFSRLKKTETRDGKHEWKKKVARREWRRVIGQFLRLEGSSHSSRVQRRTVDGGGDDGGGQETTDEEEREWTIPLHRAPSASPVPASAVSHLERWPLVLLSPGHSATVVSRGFAVWDEVVNYRLKNI